MDASRVIKDYTKKHLRFRENGLIVSTESKCAWICNKEQRYSAVNYIGQMEDGLYHGCGNVMYDDKYFITGTWFQGKLYEGEIHNLTDNNANIVIDNINHTITIE